MEKYVYGLSLVYQHFPENANQMALYIIKINPRHWTVFDNLDQIIDDEWYSKYLKKQDHYVHGI